MTREWQPGDVAILPSCDIAVVDRDGHFVYGRGEFDNARPGSINATSARPLAVIDPEDREQVERLSEMVADEIVRNGLKPRDAMQAALREYANPTPPKPKEPTGLGAVVEAPHPDGARQYGMRRYVRGHATRAPWMGGGGKFEWGDMPTPITVLSEGVQP